MKLSVFLSSKNNFWFFNTGAGNQGMVSDNWRFTFRTIAIERRTLPINKDQYQFGKELGSGAFGAVYSARKMSDSQ